MAAWYGKGAIANRLPDKVCFLIRKNRLFLQNMRRLGNSNVIKIILLFCVAMQVVAVMPHHHHGENVHVCLDSAHAAGSEVHRDMCSVVHSNHGFPYTVCLSHGIVMAQPDVRDDSVEEAVTDHMPDCCCLHCTPQAAEFVSENLVETFLSGFSGDHSPESYLTTYITDALPCRAPDFMC